jgi:beta-lysine 5,6-aminomutase alpha subunit
MIRHKMSARELGAAAASKKVTLATEGAASDSEIRERARELCGAAVDQLVSLREKRDALRSELHDPFDAQGRNGPLLYVIVATGNIYDDVIQARAAAQAGADAIAVIRSTAQSLLDYVPHGATTEGFGGTYATQENFRIMREALDDESRKLGRYIRLTNYCSGLCMAEIAALEHWNVWIFF